MTAGVQEWEHKLFDRTAERFAFSIKKILEKLFSIKRELQNCASPACFSSWILGRQSGRIMGS